MFEKACIEFADQILRSYYFQPGPRRINRNSNVVSSRASISLIDLFLPIFVDLDSIRIAALMLRKLKPTQFGSTSIKVTENFIDESINPEIANFFEESLAHKEKSVNYLAAITAEQRVRFYAFIEQVLATKITTETFSFPLDRICVQSNYDGDNFFILNGDDIGIDGTADIIGRIKEQHAINGWIGCSAPFPDIAQKTKRIVLGAISTRLAYGDRTLKTLRKPVDGFVTHNPLSWTSCREHLPPIAYDIIIDKADFWWLDRIDNLLSSNTPSDRQLLKALEYFYLGWFLSRNDRVPFNLMSLDAVFGQGIKFNPITGDKIGDRDKFVSGICEVFHEIIGTKRLNEIYGLRSQFFHGGSPDIYDSKKYDKYLLKYQCDPVLDIEYLAASCLRRILFGTEFEIQKNPYFDDVEELKDRGILPTEACRNTIIQES